MKTCLPHRSSIADLAANLVAVACYLCLLLFWGVGAVLLLVVFFCEKKSGLVRFHAVQALLLWLLRSLLGGDLSFEGLAAVFTQNTAYLTNPLGWAGSLGVIAARLLISAVVVLCAVLCAVNAYNWRAFKVPLLGQLAMWICRRAAPAAYSGDGPVPPECEIRPAGGRGAPQAGDEPRAQAARAGGMQNPPAEPQKPPPPVADSWAAAGPPAAEPERPVKPDTGVLGGPKPAPRNAAEANGALPCKAPVNGLSVRPVETLMRRYGKEAVARRHMEITGGPGHTIDETTVMDIGLPAARTQAAGDGRGPEADTNRRWKPVGGRSLMDTMELPPLGPAQPGQPAWAEEAGTKGDGKLRRRLPGRRDRRAEPNGRLGADDPNRNLPSDMRDPPMPFDL